MTATLIDALCLAPSPLDVLELCFLLADDCRRDVGLPFGCQAFKRPRERHRYLLYAVHEGCHTLVNRYARGKPVIGWGYPPVLMTHPSGVDP